MKTKTYRFGKITCKATLKHIGEGWECCFMFGGKQIFVGNFIHMKEANAWWNCMNREVRQFTKRFWVTQSFPIHFYGNFMKNHLYKTYYNYLDRAFGMYTRSFKTALNRDLRKYSKIRRHKHWMASQRITLKSKAA